MKHTVSPDGGKLTHRESTNMSDALLHQILYIEPRIYEENQENFGSNFVCPSVSSHFDKLLKTISVNLLRPNISADPVRDL